MKNSYIKLSLFFLLLLFSCSEEAIDEIQFGTVSGRVVESGTFEPIPNVKVFSSPNSSIVFTDANGNFSMIDVPIGDYSYQAKKDGYITKFEAATIANGANTELVFELELSTSENRPPDTPVLVLPADNATNQDIQVDLSWTATDPDDDTLIFQVILKNDANTDEITYPNITEPTFQLTNLVYGVKYFWQVTASDGINALVYSSIKSFSTTEFPITRFLYVKKIGQNNVIFTSDDDGNEIQLTDSATNSWRPRKNNQSNKIAFIRSNGAQNHIYIMNPDGTNIFKVTNNVPIAGFNSDYINFSWNANGSQIIYPNFDRLYRINSSGSGLTQIYQTPTSKLISECDWSFDATKIAIKTNNLNGYTAEIYIISSSGAFLTQVITPIAGAVGGLNFSVSGQKLLFTRDVSGFENANYRQLDTRIFQHVFSTGTTSEILTQKPPGTVDLDVRYSPNEAEVIFVNTSNDFLSTRYIQKYQIGTIDSRVTLFSGTTMPDWE
ncbi:carboxypeptidase regulatory-like domain-containing protein [uncultured Flavobacterium sp.]|uniref:carboxypeptidase regulatory-like domain-containing protein n=1 Tax=uncultured Flavobacterium sp. TaxID=165435 RepID=UPI0030EF598C|tara:strand:- start:9048 stop:10532 length:1485 start_codon:yes stop_codon:yes gene_type:complete